MALTKGVPIILDKPRMMRFTTNALCTMEQLSGIKITQINLNAAGFIEIRALLFAALYADDSSMTLNKAGDLIDEYGLDAFVDKLGEALDLSLNGGKQGNGQAPTAAE